MKEMSRPDDQMIEQELREYWGHMGEAVMREMLDESEPATEN